MSGVVFLVLRILIIITLYVFLGWALWLLWRDLKQQVIQTGVSLAPTIQLELLGEKSNTVYRFSNSTVLLGRDLTCDCRLKNRTVSAQHARMFYRQHQWWVDDLHSRNGTFLNQEKVTSPLVLVNNDELRFGAVSFRVSLEETGIVPSESDLM